MITNLSIKNFKSHKKTDLKLNNITVFCGQNGVGKSSTIQALLLLRQSYLHNRLQRGLRLNKPLYSLGSGADVLCSSGDSDIVSLELTINNEIISKWNFEVKNLLALRADLIPFLEDSIIPKIDENISIFSNSGFQYISAQRGTNYERDDDAVRFGKQLSINEGKAELTAQFLFEYQTNEVNPMLFHESTNANNLLLQASAWQREISKGVNILPKKTGDFYDIKYSFDKDDGDRTNEFKAQNVGFGLSYSLPVIVAALAAPTNSLILVENPEAHLHPYGQAKLAELLCIAAESGVQIVIETHSDHFINGICIACKRFEEGKRGINREHVSIYNFDRDEYTHTAQATEIVVLPKGRIRRPPKGFFDQLDNDLNELMS
jgi:predicted ATPase